MKKSVAILRTLASFPLIIAACLTEAMAVSVSRHFVLVAYGFGVSDTLVALSITVFGIVGLICFALGSLVWRSKLSPTRVLLVTSPLYILLGTFSIFLLYSLEIKYEKGESNLRCLADFCRDLPSWQSRKVLLRTGILRVAHLEPLPDRTPLNATLHSRRERNGYSVENVILETIPGFFLAGNLYRPLPWNEGSKKPVVLIPHGHFPNGRFNEDTQQLAATFARMGAMAFTYDMAGRGETTQVNHKNPNALTLQIWDSMRVLDFLLSLPDADPARVGMTGASGGGTQTFLCSAVDDRVKVAAPVVMVSSWVYGGCACESGLPIHCTREYRTNNAEIAALTAPRPQLIVSIDEDWTHTVPNREFPYIRGIYTLFGKEDLVRNVHLPSERHDFGPSKRDAVYRFFAEHLNLSLAQVTAPDGKIDEKKNVIEPEEAMHAFDTAHSLPVGALKDWESVMACLMRREHR